MANDLIATSLILSSAVLHASSSAVFRSDGDRLSRIGVGSIVSLPLMGAVAFFVPFPGPEVWPYLFSSLAVIVTFQLLVMKSLEFGPLSYIYPMSRGMGPVVVVLISAFYLSHVVEVKWAEVIGVSLVAIGVLEMASRGYKEAEKKHHLVLATSLAVLSGVCIGVYTLIDAIGVKMVANPFSYIAWLMIMFGGVFLALPIIARGRRVIPIMAQELRKGLLGAILGMASYVTALLALRLGSAVEIAALRETSIMFAVLIGYFFLGEGIGVRRLVAVSLIAVGAIVIKSF